MRLAPRWRKVAADITASPGRTCLAVIAMAAGLFGFGAILVAYGILNRELAVTYRDTRPSSATLLLGGAPVDAEAAVRRVPGVIDAELRPVIRGRVRVGSGEWVPLLLFVVEDFERLRVDTFRRDTGDWPAADDAVAIERSALTVARAVVGDRITVMATGGGAHTLRITGTVHAAGLAPGWMEHVVYGFVRAGSVMPADAPDLSRELRIVAGAGGPALPAEVMTAGAIRIVAADARLAIEAAGGRVSRITVPPPGRHPHADQMDTFLFLLGAFGVLTILLGAVVVATMMAAMLAQQVRQIGSMRAIGATSRQIAALYLVQVSALAALSLTLALPLAVMAGRGYADFAATVLNATIADPSTPMWVFAVAIGVGIGVPVLAALAPVVTASRISIHQAFSVDGGRRVFGTGAFDRGLASLSWLPRPLMLSLRTTFHERTRLILTLGTLTVGGVVFLAALNVSAAWSRAIGQDAASWRYDLEVRLTKPRRASEIDAAVAPLPNIVRAEYWSEAEGALESPAADARPAGGAATPIRAASIHGESVDMDRVQLVGPDEGTDFVHLPMIEGRWLQPGDGRVVVLTPALAALDTGLQVGREVRLRINGRTTSFLIVGIARTLLPMAAAFTPGDLLRQSADQMPGQVRTLRLRARAADAGAVQAASADVERALSDAGVPVNGVVRLADRRQGFEDHLVIIVSALMFAAGLVVIVGGMGLTSTLTLNVMGRTRDIGVLGAIGATRRVIARQVLWEALIIGLLSWLLALAVSIPVTAGLCAVTGRIFIRTPVDFMVSAAAAGEWLALVMVLSAMASFYPARRAARLTVREALAYG